VIERLNDTHLLFSFGPITACLGWFHGWLRLWGHGVSYKDTRRVDLTFSQRYQLAKCVLVGPWCFEWLDKVPAEMLGRPVYGPSPLRVAWDTWQTFEEIKRIRAGR